MDTHPMEIVKRRGNLIYKTIDDNHLCEEWFHYYHSYHNMYGNTVKIYGFEKDDLVMDYIEGSTLFKVITNPQVTAKASLKYYSKYMYLLSTMIEYSSHMPNNKSFLHEDMTWHNIIVNEDDELILIDPNSFTLYNDGVLSPLMCASAVNNFEKILREKREWAIQWTK